MINIRQIDNGYIISTNANAEGESIETYFDNVRELLQAVNEIYGSGSRHDKKRTYIVEAPGDKHPDFTDKHADLLWSDIDD